MSDAAQLAKNAREHLAAALNALQSNAHVPEALMDLAEPIAEAMGVLHRIERTNGSDLAGREGALENVRTALNQLQAISVHHPAIDVVMEAVAASLSKVHALVRWSPPAAVAARPSGAGAPAQVPRVGPSFAPTEPAPKPVATSAPRPAPVAQPQAAAAPIPAAQPMPSGGLGFTHAMQAAPSAAPSRNAPQAQPAYPAQGFPAPAQPAAAPIGFGGTAVLPQQPMQAAPAHAMPAVAPQMPPAHQPMAHVPHQQQAQQPAYQPAYQPAAQPMAPAQPSSAGAQPMAPAQPSSPGAKAGGAPKIDVELGAHSPSNFYKGLGGNDVIEHGGIFVATYKIPKLGSAVTLRVLMPGDYEFQASAVVQWAREGGAGESAEPGFGARFTQISPDARQLVYRYTRNREPIFYDDL